MTPEKRAGIVERDAMVYDRKAYPLTPTQPQEDRHDLLAALAEAEQHRDALVAAIRVEHEHIAGGIDFDRCLEHLCSAARGPRP